MTTPSKRFTEMSVQEILDLARPDPEYEEIQKYWPKPNVDWSNHAAAVGRLRMYTEIGEEMDEKDPQVDEREISAPGRDGLEISVRVWTAKNKSNANPRSPLIVLFFGGGYVTGSPTQVANLARELVKQFNAVVAGPAYRLAPEHPFPASINDCWDSLKFIAANAISDLGADPSKGFIVGGISAGALAANVLAHLARDEGLEPKLTGVWSSCGSARPPQAGELGQEYQDRLLSRTQKEVAADPLLSSEMQTLFLDCLKPDLNSKLSGPMIWPTDDNNKNVPRTYFQICGLDGSRDEAFTYQDLLEKDGVPTMVHLFPGLPHCFWLSLRDLKASSEWKAHTVEGFRWLLQA